MSVEESSGVSRWSPRRTESAARVVVLVATIFLSCVSWVEGPRWLTFLGAFVVAGTLPAVVADARRRLRRRDGRPRR